MKNFLKRLTAVGAGVLIVAGVLTGCGPLGGDKNAVAMVGDTAIKQDQLEKNYLLVEKMYKDMYGESVMTQQKDGKTAREIVRKEILDNLIDEALVIQYLDKQGFKVDAAQIEKRYDDLVKNQLDKNPEKKKFYETNKIDAEFMKNAIRAQLYLAEFNKRINDEVMLKNTNLDAKFDAYVVQVRARHILVEDLSKAQEIYDKIKKGADFAQLAKAVSIDKGSAVNGGDLGFFTRGKMVAAFNDKVFKMKVGEVSEPIKTEFGYHIIKVDAQKTVKDLKIEGKSSEELKPEKDKMIQELIQKRSDELMEQLRQKTKIERNLDKIK